MCILFRGISDLREDRARLQFVCVVGFVFLEIGKDRTVRIDRLQFVLGHRLTSASDAVRRLISLFVGHEDPSYRSLPEGFSHVLSFLSGDTGDYRTRALISKLIACFGRGKALDGFAVEGDVAELNGYVCLLFLEVDQIDVRRTDTGLHFDLRNTGSVRSSNGDLLSCRFVHRNSGASIAGQFHFIFQFFRLEAFERISIEIDHFKERVRRYAHDEVNSVFTRISGLGGNGDDLGRTVQDAQYTL